MSNIQKVKKLAALFILMTVPLFSQDWKDIIETDIPFSIYSKVDLCTNRNGNNVLVTYRNNPTYYLKYYLFNTSGSIVRSYTFENQEVEFAGIDGDNDKVYVVYKTGNIIRTWKSTNAGIDWSSDIQVINIGSNPCNNVDIVWGKDDNSLHMVWATQDVWYDFKTYYRRLGINDVWSPKETVTDGNNMGGFPTVSKSDNRVHVSYNTGSSQNPLSNVGDAYSRDKYSDDWQPRQLVLPDNSKRGRIHAGTSKLFDFYYEDMGGYCNLLVKQRNFDEINWSSPEILDYIADPEPIVSAANTKDGRSHIVYIISGGVGYRSYDGTSWSSESSIFSTYYSPRISSVSNDLYAIAGSSNYINFRHFDDKPVAPQNLALSNSGSPSYHPVLSWSYNNEPDVFENTTDGYLIERRIYNNGKGAWSDWNTLVNRSGHLNSYTDEEIYNATGAGPGDVEYRLKAKDNNGKVSDYSSAAGIGYGISSEKMAVQNENNIISYSLKQNYPNPFNPTTAINYSLKEKGFVELRIYDILGNEIRSLVNEMKEPGNYSSVFNASDYPSGVYIYTLRVNDYVASKKMLLIK